MEELVAAPLGGEMLAPEPSDFVIGEWTDEGGWSSAERPIAPPHVHHSDDEAWNMSSCLAAGRVLNGPGDSVFSLLERCRRGSP